MARKSNTIKPAEGEQEPAITAAPAVVSQRFLDDVERQFVAQMGEGVKFTPLEKRLTQHMFLKIDQALKAAEARRQKGTEFTWKTIDRAQLALDTVHRVSLALDALIPNHVHPVFFWNGRKNKYDVTLMIGYLGLDHVARRFAADPPLTIRYELVHDSDHFRPLPRDSSRDVEGYEFEISEPFDRGEIVGGFGYIEFEDPRKNRLVIVTPRDFDRAKAASRGGFWRDHDVEMHYKTIVRRVTGRIPLDAEKVNAAALAAALEDEADANDRVAERVAVDASQRAGRKTITIDEREAEPEPEPEHFDDEGMDARDADLEREDQEPRVDENADDEPGF